ncbi:uncharacterized protein [Ptychodera flava]|uniref:uncharacterized protein isoform X2 n=1 Tax=Ptychodera flava TaxID=63121 RepID=UPI00396A9DE7
MNMELSSSQGLFKSSQYAAMNDLLFQQFGFQVLANNIHEESTDTYPILVQSVLRESDVEIWGGFCVRAYIVKLDFQKTPGQPEMCLAILLKNKYTPDVKRLEAPFKLQAFHLQWIQNVLHADEDVDVGNAKEIPFIAMYDALELSETERTTESLKSWKDIDQSSENDARLENDGKIIARDEMESMDTGDQSIMREMSHDLSPTVPSTVCQEVSVYTDEVNNQAEGFSTDLKEVKEVWGC